MKYAGKIKADQPNTIKATQQKSSLKTDKPTHRANHVYKAHVVCSIKELTKPI